MSTKAAFLTAMGGATTAVGSTKNFTVDAGTDVVTSSAHGKDTGFGPVRLTNSGGALPAGLAGATDYWIIRLTDDTLQFATSKANALAGTAVDITGAGTGTHSMRATMQTVADQMEQALDEVLTFPGNRTQPKDVNVTKFWTEGVQGTGF